MSLINKKHLFKIKNFNRFSYNFSDGRPIEDKELVSWMSEIYEKMNKDFSINYMSRACGRSLIIAHKIVDDEKKAVDFSIDFYIIDSYMNLTLFNNEKFEDFIDISDVENKPCVFFNKEEMS